MITWGRHYLMVRPDHYRIDYEINPFMDRALQPDPIIAMDQWNAMRTAIEGAGGTVDVLEQRPDAPDMVFAMNLALAVTGADGVKRAVVSHMRYPQRRIETATAGAWLTEHGWITSRTGHDGVGAHFEAGDAFLWRGELLVGHGPRTEELALKHLRSDLRIPVQGVRLIHPGLYHFDLAFCPLDERRAIIATAAFDEATATRLIAAVPEPLLISEAEAMTFCANSIVVGSTVIMPTGSATRVVDRLRDWGFAVVLVDVSEFHLAGGSVRCLAAPLDIHLGR